MRPWRVIDCSTMSGRLDSVRGALRVRTDRGVDEIVPVADVAIILVGHGVSLGPSVLHRLALDDVVLLVCDWRGVPAAIMSPWSDHGRVGARHRAQSELTLPRRKRAWQPLVAAKVRGQAQVLERFGAIKHLALRELAGRVRSGDPENIEAQAARLYWRSLFGDHFYRDPGGSSGVNALLDYGYGVLRGRGIRATLTAGLSTPLGVFHRGRGNYFNLVDDLIEPFRPAVDDAVMALGQHATLEDSLVRSHLVAASTRTFTHAGAGVGSELDSLAQQFGRYVEGDVERLLVPHWDGPWESPDVDF